MYIYTLSIVGFKKAECGDVFKKCLQHEITSTFLVCKSKPNPTINLICHTDTRLHLVVRVERCSHADADGDGRRSPFHVCCGCGRGWWGSAGAATTPAHSSSSSDAPHDSDPSALSTHTHTNRKTHIQNLIQCWNWYQINQQGGLMEKRFSSKMLILILRLVYTAFNGDIFKFELNVLFHCITVVLLSALWI